MCNATLPLYARATAAVMHSLFTVVTVEYCSVLGVCRESRYPMHGIPAKLSPFRIGGTPTAQSGPPLQ